MPGIGRNRFAQKDNALILDGMMRFLAGIALLGVLASTRLAAQIPEKITVVTDDNYPPYLFRNEDGRLIGLLVDKWELWSSRNNVAVEIHGMSWADAQTEILSGKWDVIDPLSYTEMRAPLYEFSASSAVVESRIYFHHTITGINDTNSLRGFTIGVKKGSACAEWLTGKRVLTQRLYPTMLDLVRGAAAGEVRLFCADTQPTQYFLSKLELTQDFRQTQPLYSTRLHWAVRRGRTDLLQFVERGFEKIKPDEMKQIDERWLGTPLPQMIDPVYYRYGGTALGAVLIVGAILLAWNTALRRRVAAGTRELREALAELQNKNVELERFTYTISHDLKGPLVTIKTFSGSLLDGIAKKDFTNFEADLKRIDRAATMMRLLLDDLLELTRAGVLHNAVRIDLYHAVSKVIESLDGLRVGKNIQVDVAPDLPAVHMDEQRLTQVIQNLLGNAFKYTSEHEPPRIQIRAETSGEKVLFCVQDNGIGIEPQYHDVVFGLFNKLNPAAEGTGIGLAIVRRIVEVYGGRAWVESEGSGKGASFYCELPRAG